MSGVERAEQAARGSWPQPCGGQQLGAPPAAGPLVGRRIWGRIKEKREEEKKKRKERRESNRNRVIEGAREREAEGGCEMRVNQSGMKIRVR
jgi:hypothetical protein